MSIKHVVCFYWIIFSSWSHLFKLLNISKDLTSDYLFVIYSKSDFYRIFQSAAAAKLLQSCPTVCDLIDGSPPGSSVPRILQARTLEWVAIAFSYACMHAKKLQSCLTVRPYGQQLLCPRDSLGKNTGVGCHFLLPCQAHLVLKDKSKRKYITYSFFFLMWIIPFGRDEVWVWSSCRWSWRNM